MVLVDLGGDAGASRGAGVRALAAEPRAVASETRDLGVVDERGDPGGSGHVVADDLAPVETGLVPVRIIEACS
jgi:hypothetical protein